MTRFRRLWSAVVALGAVVAAFVFTSRARDRDDRDDRARRGDLVIRDGDLVEEAEASATIARRERGIRVESARRAEAIRDEERESASERDGEERDAERAADRFNRI